MTATQPLTSTSPRSVPAVHWPYLGFTASGSIKCGAPRQNVESTTDRASVTCQACRALLGQEVSPESIKVGDAVEGLVWCRKNGREYTREVTVVVDRTPWFAGRNMILSDGRSVTAVLRGSVRVK